MGIDWLVRTKLTAPSLRPDLLPRPRLVEAIHAGLASHRLVLLSAPAGSGKTTLVTAALQADPSLRAIWVSLDEDDNDPARFFALLLAAFKCLTPRGSAAETLMNSLNNPGAHARQIVGLLINDVLEMGPDPLVLVLDDVHLLTEPAIFVALDYLLERLPLHVRLVVMARHDPPLALARLRARGELTELRFAELCFTPDETAVLLQQHGECHLSADDLALVHERMEGWAAGLRLLTSALHGLPAIHNRAFLDHLARAERHVFDFLAEEVLSREAPEARSFLLETSILSRLTPTLCQAVTGCPGAAPLLDDLERRNVFVTALEEEDRRERSYRYHDIFAAFLRRQLQLTMPECVAELHRRAAAAHPDPAEAIAHWLAAGQPERAAEVMEAMGEGLLRRGQLSTLRDWINALPPDVREARPRLIQMLALCTFRQGSLPAACTLLEQAAQALALHGEREAQGEALSYLALGEFLLDDIGRSSATAEQALALPLTTEHRVQLLAERAHLGLVRGDAGSVTTDLDAALTLARASDDERAVATLVAHLDPMFTTQAGGLERVEQMCEMARARLSNEASPLRAAVAAQRAVVCLARGQLTACQEAGERALALREQYGSENPILDIWAMKCLVAVHLARGDDDAARRWLDAMMRQIEFMSAGSVLNPIALFMRGHAYWLLGRSEEIRRADTNMVRAPDFPEVSYTAVLAAVLRTMLHGLVQMDEGHYDAAAETLRHAVQMQAASSLSTWCGNARFLLAHAYLSMGRPRQALAEIEPALELYEACQMPGFVLKEGRIVIPLLRLAVERGLRRPFAVQLLELAGAPARPAPVRVPQTGETLSSREVELLRLLSDGAGTREIAARLVISVPTVKTHIAHILRKLDADSRGAAVARGRTLGLL